MQLVALVSPSRTAPTASMHIPVIGATMTKLAMRKEVFMVASGAAVANLRNLLVALLIQPVPNAL